MKMQNFLSIKPGSADEDALNSLLFKCRSKAQKEIIKILYPFCRNIQHYWGAKIDVFVEKEVEGFKCDIYIEFTESDKLSIKVAVEVQGNEHRSRTNYRQDIHKMDALRKAGCDVLWVENLDALRHPAHVVKRIFERVDSIRWERYEIEMEAWESMMEAWESIRPKEPKELIFPRQLKELIQNQAKNGIEQDSGNQARLAATNTTITGEVPF